MTDLVCINCLISMHYVTTPRPLLRSLLYTHKPSEHHYESCRYGMCLVPYGIAHSVQFISKMQSFQHSTTTCPDLGERDVWTLDASALSPGANCCVLDGIAHWVTAY